MTHWIPASEAWAHVAFYERERAQGKIYAKLIGGQVSARAKFYTLNNAEHRDAQMPREFWDIHWTRLDFTSGDATRAVFDVFASIDEHGQRVIRQHSSDSATGVLIDRDELLTFWPPIPGTEKPKAIESPHPGGRPPAADWIEIEKAVEREIALVGFPHRDGVPGWRFLADVIRFIRPMLGDDEPSLAALKKNTRAMLERIKAKWPETSL